MDQPIASAFGEQAFAYRDYLEGPSGRLRQEIAWRRVSTFLEHIWNTASVPRSILDAGCGTGELAFHLAQIGHQVVLLDPAEEMPAVLQPILDHEADLHGIRGHYTHFRDSQPMNRVNYPQNHADCKSH